MPERSVVDASPNVWGSEEAPSAWIPVVGTAVGACPNSKMFGEAVFSYLSFVLVVGCVDPNSKGVVWGGVLSFG
jgi:hypothetical protein